MVNLFDRKRRKRVTMIITGIVDTLLGAAVLLSYFGLIPFSFFVPDLPAWLIAGLGMMLFLAGLGVLTTQLIQGKSLDE